MTFFLRVIQVLYSNMLKLKAIKIGEYVFSVSIDKDIETLCKSQSPFELIETDDSLSFFYFDEAAKSICIYEWKRYYIQSVKNSLHQNLFNNRGEFISSSLGVIQFQNSIGRSKFSDFHFEVLSHKLDKKAFKALLSFVESYGHKLSLSNNAPSVGFHASRNSSSFFSNPYFQLKYLLENFNTQLYPWLLFLINNPHRLSESTSYYEKIELAHDFDINSMLEVFSNTSEFSPTTISCKLSEAINKDDQHFLPLELSVGEEIDTFDTNENRFVKYFLSSLVQLINKYEHKYDFSSDHMLSNKNFVAIKKKLSYFVDQSLLRSCGHMTHFPFSSQVMKRQTPYKKVFDFYMKIKTIPHLNFSDTSFDEILALKNIDRLYEYFCFFKLDEIISSLSPSFQKNKNIQLQDLNLSLTLSQSFISYSSELFTLKLFYKKKYTAPHSSYSLEFEPDYSLEICNNRTLKEHLIFFDAKFKFENGYAKSEDIHKMHSYKDALFGFASFVLFPGSYESFFADPKSTSNLSGVGSFILHPHNPLPSLGSYLSSIIFPS
jgi:uncharacterized protein